MENFSDFLPGILLAYAAFLLGIMSPGPNVLAVMGTSMAKGRNSGVALALGVAFGSLAWASLTVAGLSALLAAYASALIFIKIFGGLFLLWLAFKAFKSAASSHELEQQELAGGKRTPMGYFLRGFVVQMTNPKAALAWIAIISLGLGPAAPWWVGLMIVSGTFALSIGIHILYAIAFSTKAAMRIYGKARRTIQFGLGTFFTIAGVRLLTSRT